MDDLVNLIDNISIDKSNIDDIDYFKFNELSLELDKMEYESLRKKALIENVLKWIKINKTHTFPKRKKSWINTFRTQYSFLKTDIKFRPQYIINNIITKKTPKYLENICKKIYKIIETFHEIIDEESIKKLLRKMAIWCSLIVSTKPEELIELLINVGVLIETDKNLVINEELFLSQSKKRRHDDIVIEEYSDNSEKNFIISNIKKIKND